MILLGILIGIFIGGCFGVIIMAVVAVAHESREEAGRVDEQAEVTQDDKERIDNHYLDSLIICSLFAG